VRWPAGYVLLDRDEARQAVDEAVAHDPRHLLRKDQRKDTMELHAVVEPDNRLQRRRRLAAAIGIDGDVRRQERSQLLHVAAAGRHEEGSGDLLAAFLGHGKAGAGRAEVGPRAAGKLAAGRRRTTDGPGDLLEADAEHVVEEKGGALKRRKTLKSHHQRQRDIVDLLLHRLDDRFRQPGPDIGLAPAPRGFQVVEAKARHDAAQKRFRLAYRISIGIEPAEERLLDDILRVRDRSEHPVRDAHQSWPQGVKRGSRVVTGHCRQAALRSATG